MASRTTRSQSRYRKSPDRLSPEILLSIFLNLTSEEIVSLRRVCKKWLDVIDTNKLLWRNLEWIGTTEESIEHALEMFDEKSASTLETVSIQEKKWSKDLQRPIVVLSKSGATLKSLTFLTFWPNVISGQLLELARSSPNLEKLVLWNAQESLKEFLPLIHPVRNRKTVDADSSASRLKVLWLFAISSEEFKQILDLPTQLVKSLISFAIYGANNFQDFRPFLTKFSETIVHLDLTITHSEPRIDQPLFCPNLRILEGNFQPGVSLYFDCPNLKHLILWFGPGSELQRTPSSVEQLWLKSITQDFTAEVWEPLLSSCPRMEVLKLKRLDSRNDKNLQPEALIQVLEKRQEKINKGEEIQGLRVLPLQSLVLSLSLLSKDQLERARKVAVKVVDIQDYPDFVELEY